MRASWRARCRRRCWAWRNRITAAEGEPPSDQAERRRRRRRQRSGPSPPSAGDGPTVLADVRTNSLVLIATPASLEVAQDIVAQLDIPTPAGRGQIHVYYLSHADAEELAQVLTAQAPEITPHAGRASVRADSATRRACNRKDPPRT